MTEIVLVRPKPQAAGILPDHVLISATHTHKAPTVTGVFQGGRGVREVFAAQDRGGSRLPTTAACLQDLASKAADEGQVFNRGNAS